jgi:hypothetical protein
MWSMSRAGSLRAACAWSFTRCPAIHPGYYRNAIGAAAAVPFLDVVSYRFGLADPEAHYHLPMKCTPWGYSCFRGGA